MQQHRNITRSGSSGITVRLFLFLFLFVCLFFVCCCFKQGSTLPGGARMCLAKIKKKKKANDDTPGSAFWAGVRGLKALYIFDVFFFVKENF